MLRGVKRAQNYTHISANRALVFLHCVFAHTYARVNVAGVDTNCNHCTWVVNLKDNIQSMSLV